jgi:chromosome partitioning protein
MTIIALANSKGGVGKSTLCLLIASELAENGASVLIVDTDPQQSCLQWVDRCKRAGTLPLSLQALSASSPHDLKVALTTANASIILIDVQGSINDLLVAAIVASDITLVPAKANVMEMVETVKLFEWAQSSLKRAPLRLILNRVEGIDTNTAAFQDAVQMIRDNKLPALPTFVRARKVYEQFSKEAGSLVRIGKDPGKVEQVNKARANIVGVITDITRIIGETE